VSVPIQISIEDIEGLRRREGIEDVELQEQIRGLRIADFVKLTLMDAARPSVCETVLVRITRMTEVAYRGRLVRRPTCKGLSHLAAGRLLTFTAAQIHSLPKRVQV
jgi:hypothetical protein